MTISEMANLLLQMVADLRIQQLLLYWFRCYYSYKYGYIHRHVDPLVLHKFVHPIWVPMVVGSVEDFTSIIDHHFKDLWKLCIVRPVGMYYQLSESLCEIASGNLINKNIHDIWHISTKIVTKRTNDLVLKTKSLHVYWSKSATKRVISCPLISKMHHTNLTVTSMRQGELLKLICLWKQNEYLNCQSSISISDEESVTETLPELALNVISSQHLWRFMGACLQQWRNCAGDERGPPSPLMTSITNLIALNVSCFAAEIAPKLAPPFDNRSSICQRHFLSKLLNRKLCYRCNSRIPSQYVCIGCWTELQILANLW